MDVGRKGIIWQKSAPTNFWVAGTWLLLPRHGDLHQQGGKNNCLPLKLEERNYFCFVDRNGSYNLLIP